ncbi:muts domain V-domain-containing protein [Blastocladiella britannica]|nr:muts domain V-domain-containing protein [Blastocladiella britannica]
MAETDFGDKSSQQRFFDYLRSLPEPSSTVVRLFERNQGDFYSAHLHDALFVAQHVYNTATVIKQLGSRADPVPSVTLSRATYLALLPSLLASNRSVEIYALAEPRRANSWHLARTASPGNTQQVDDDLLLASSSSNGTNAAADDPVALSSSSSTSTGVDPIVVAVVLDPKSDISTTDGVTVGLAVGNATDRTLGAVQLVDCDLLATLEAALVSLGARECLASYRDLARFDGRLRAVLSAADIVVTERSESEFATAIHSDVLRGALDAPLPLDSQLDASNAPLAARAAAAVVAFLGILDSSTTESTKKRYSAVPVKLAGVMRLDAHAVSALDIFPPPLLLQQSGTTRSSLASAHATAKSYHTLYGLLNSAMSTPPGSRTLAAWLRQPLTDVLEIAARHDAVQALTDRGDVREGARAWLKRFAPDIPRLVKKLRRGRAGVQDAVVVYQVARRIVGSSAGEAAERMDVDRGQEEEEEEENSDPDAVTTAGRTSAAQTTPPDLRALLATDPVLADRFGLALDATAPNLAALVALIESTVDLEAVDMHAFRVLPHVDESLLAMHESIAALESRINPIAKKVASQLGLEVGKTIKVDHSSVHGFHLRVSLANASKLRGQKDLTDLATLKSGVLFTTAELRRIATELLELGLAYAAQQNEVVRQLMEQMEQYLPSLTLVAETLADLDVLSTFAHTGLQAPTPYTRPTMISSEKGNLELRNLRHACIEMQPGMQFIGNDVSMRRGVSEFAIISGPNMGGKSTYARSIALASLMAQIGCFVPCDSGATMPVFDAIHCRIGAGDNAARGVSTFMAEMLETAAILRSATPRSLVVMDELGRGTSTADGFGLAYAISHHLASTVRAFTLFATHFHEMTALEAAVPTVTNLHVAAFAPVFSSDDDDTPLEAGAAAAAAATMPMKKHDVTLLYKVEPGPADKSFGIHVADVAGFPAHVIHLAREKLAELEDLAAARKRDREASRAALSTTSNNDGDDHDQVREQKRGAKLLMREFLAGWNQLSETDQTGPAGVAMRAQYLAKAQENAWLRDFMAGVGAVATP